VKHLVRHDDEQISGPGKARNAGIETAHVIRKGQIMANGASAFQVFAGLAA
jgi:hypothetical protein